MAKVATVVVFPGSNCDREAFNALEKSGFRTTFTWFEDSLPANLDVCFIPGGFSYGDYLRSGTVSAHTKIMNEVRTFAEKGGYLIGACNGFQIMTEAKILPGALLKNACGHFVCKVVDFKTAGEGSVFTSGLRESVKMQVAHGDGMYYADPETIKMLEGEGRVAFYYEEGQNFNGSINSIAGVIGGKNRNIMGLMPHPERLMASSDAMQIFSNLFNA